MRIAFGTDDDNECVHSVLNALREVAEVEVVSSAGTSWVHFARTVGERVAAGAVDFGFVMCWTGTGTAIAANKVQGVRAVTAWEPWIARNARAWNDANVLALSSRRTSPDVAVECVQAFLSTGVDPAESETLDELNQPDR